MAVLGREPITKDHIQRTEYREKRRTRVKIFEVPQLIKVVIFVSRIVSGKSRCLLRSKALGMEVQYYVDNQAFIFIANCLDVRNEIMTVVEMGPERSAARLFTWPFLAQKRRPLGFRSQSTKIFLCLALIVLRLKGYVSDCFPYYAIDAGKHGSTQG